MWHLIIFLTRRGECSVCNSGTSLCLAQGTRRRLILWHGMNHWLVDCSDALGSHVFLCSLPWLPYFSDVVVILTLLGASMVQGLEHLPWEWETQIYISILPSHSCNLTCLIRLLWGEDAGGEKVVSHSGDVRLVIYPAQLCCLWLVAGLELSSVRPFKRKLFPGGSTLALLSEHLEAK